MSGIIKVACDVRNAKTDDELTAGVDKLSRLYRAANTLVSASKRGGIEHFMLMDLDNALGEIDDAATTDDT